MAKVLKEMSNDQIIRFMNMGLRSGDVSKCKKELRSRNVRVMFDSYVGFIEI